MALLGPDHRGRSRLIPFKEIHVTGKHNSRRMGRLMDRKRSIPRLSRGRQRTVDSWDPNSAAQDGVHHPDLQLHVNVRTLALKDWVGRHLYLDVKVPWLPAMLRSGMAVGFRTEGT